MRRARIVTIALAAAGATALTASGAARPAAAAPASERAQEQPKESDYRLSLGPFYAGFSGGYGQWFGGHARLWFLDVTGLKGISGYADLIDLHWRPEADGASGERGGADSYYALGRVLKNWNESLYTFLTVGGTLGDAVFPRLLGELELDYEVPKVKGLVLAFGGGDRYYPTANRPYLLAGVSYALPRAAVIYRFWVGRGLARRRSTTHLMTWFYGERLSHWVRLDLLWGDEVHSLGLAPLLFDADVESRSVALTLERWFTRHLGVGLRVEVTEGHIDGPSDVQFHRVQTLVQPFWEF